MKSIVSTIQKEQNTAIRHEGTKVLAIQGAAGSGKTSVATHRASYLLYRHKKTISANNLVILSSTGVLGEYISDVLPELGEEEIKGITYSTLLERYMKTGFSLETQPGMLESILTAHERAAKKRLESIRLKSSQVFIEAIEKLFDYFLKDIVKFETLVYNNQIIATEQELNELFFKDFADMPAAKRLKRMESRISERLKALKKAKASQVAKEMEDKDSYLSKREANALSRRKINLDARDVDDKIARMFNINPLDLYGQLFSSEEAFGYCLGDNMKSYSAGFLKDMRKETLAQLSTGKIAYEDQAPVLALALLLGVVEPDRTVKHLLVDEAQDYSAIQLYTLSKLFPSAGITLLGDINQNISLNASALTLEEAAQLMAPGDYTMLTLNKSYRSTYEITRFASGFLKIPSGEPFGRHGPMPQLITSPTREDFLRALTDRVLSEAKEGYKSIAIITRTQKQANALHNELKKSLETPDCPFRLLDENFEYQLEGIMVVPSYLSKGLEFDTVHVVFEDSGEYGSENERGLLYTVFSRALHRLTLYSTGPMPPVVLNKPDLPLNRGSNGTNFDS